jgi:hypothetical protein
MVHAGFIACPLRDAATGGMKLVLVSHPLVESMRRGYDARDPDASAANADAMRALLEAVERGETEALQGFCGACFDTPQAGRVRKLLRDAAAALPQAASAGVLHHAMPHDALDGDFRSAGLAGELYLRCVCAWGGAEAEAEAWPVGADAFEMDDPDESATLLLLTHTFELPPEPRGGGAARGRRLSLQTLAAVSDQEDGNAAAAPDALSMRVVFGDDAPTHAAARQLRHCGAPGRPAAARGRGGAAARGRPRVRARAAAAGSS